ncbi:hypothetical protein Tco_0999699 [Tanacetum coccineum]
MQTHASKVDSSKALDADLVVMESNGTKSGKHDTNNSSWNYLTHVVDAYIRLVNDQMPFAEAQLTSQRNVFANEQQHTKQSEPIYDTYLLEKIDSNTTPDLTNMCHRGGEIDQRPSPPFLGLVVWGHFMVGHDGLASHEKSGSTKERKIKKSKLLKANPDRIEKVPETQHGKFLPFELARRNPFLLSELGVADLFLKDGDESMSIKEAESTAFEILLFSSLSDRVNSRAKVQSPKSRNNIKPAKRIPNVNKPERWNAKGYRFSSNKSSIVHEKPNTPRSCLRWKLTGRIFKTTGLRWIPTGKMFTDSTTKVDSDPLNGSNDDITNPYECDQTLNVGAETKGSRKSNVMNKNKWRLQTTLQASLLKEKKSVRFSALYLQKKRNLLVSYVYSIN